VAEPPEAIFDPRRILVALAEHRVEFVVVGGVAVQSHGHGRATRDLDVIPKPDLLNLTRLGECLSELGARLIGAERPVDVTDPQLLRRAAMLPLMTTHGRLDLLNAETTEGAPRSWDELRSRASEASIDGHVIAVAGLDDLIRMKRAAGRDHDLADIAALTRTDEELQAEQAT
jgi:predicted nucleotidyltransferase